MYYNLAYFMGSKGFNIVCILFVLAIILIPICVFFIYRSTYFTRQNTKKILDELKKTNFILEKKFK